MDVVEVDRLRCDLSEFASDVFASLTRAGWQERAAAYLQGLMIDGRRKSIQPMAARLQGVHEQALNHFVTNSPWQVEPVRQRIAALADQAIGPAAWAIDDTGLLKCGTASPCVARQYTGTVGKVTNCQIAVSVSMVTDTASCPVDWRLFLPESWDPASPKATADVHARRRRAGIGDGVAHREKWRLALDMIDELLWWGHRPPLIVADCGYGDAAEFRHALTERRLPYLVQVSGRLTAYPAATTRTAGEYAGVGSYPTPRYHHAAPTLTELITTGPARPRRVTWRPGSRLRAGRQVLMSSHFVFTRVRPAGRTLLSAHRGEDLPECWLITEWPPGSPEPIKYWLSDLPATTAKRTLIRWAKLRWRIEHDYREVKTGLGLDHYEGRTWQGWHHHVTLVSAAHIFLTLQRLDPKTRAPE
ncbi:IS701 family transposase [Actinoplanes sp. NPDC051861]|uniref:IS701 family transposase n=1 Tax=Actinoplanes sp. NPDC051861 TaxID=3155170 RepID=UPI0034464FF0